MASVLHGRKIIGGECCLRYDIFLSFRWNDLNVVADGSIRGDRALTWIAEVGIIQRVLMRELVRGSQEGRLGEDLAVVGDEPEGERKPEKPEREGDSVFDRLRRSF